MQSSGAAQDEPQCHLRQSQAAETCAENVSVPAGRERREADRGHRLSRGFLDWGGRPVHCAVQGPPGEVAPRGAGGVY